MNIFLLLAVLTASEVLGSRELQESSISGLRLSSQPPINTGAKGSIADRIRLFEGNKGVPLKPKGAAVAPAAKATAVAAKPVDSGAIGPEGIPIDLQVEHFVAWLRRDDVSQLHLMSFKGTWPETHPLYDAMAGVTCDTNTKSWLLSSKCVRPQVQDVIARQVLVLRIWMLQVMRGLQEGRLATELTRWFGSSNKATRDMLEQMLETAYASFDSMQFEFLPEFEGYARIHSVNMVNCIARKSCSVELGAVFFESAGVLTMSTELPDSRGGTLFHEITHLIKANNIPIKGGWAKEVRGEKEDGQLGAADYVYGREDCIDLAKSLARNARHNADNFGFFLEDAVISERKAADASTVGLYGQLGEASVVHNRVNLPTGYKPPSEQACSNLLAKYCTGSCKEKRVECLACGGSCAAPAEPVAMGRLLRIEKEAVFHQAVDSQFGIFILKRPKQSAQENAPSFVREKAIANVLSGTQGICKVAAVDPQTYDPDRLGTSGSLLLEGSTGNLMKSGRFRAPMGSEAFLDMLQQMAGVLREAHRVRVAHGDIKPQNFECLSELCDKICLGNFWLGVIGDSLDDTLEIPLAALRPELEPEWSRLPELRNPSLPISIGRIVEADWYGLGLILLQSALGEKAWEEMQSSKSSIGAFDFRAFVAMSLRREAGVGSGVAPLLILGLLEERSEYRLKLDIPTLLSHDIHTGLGDHDGVCEHLSQSLTHQVGAFTCVPRHQVLDDLPFLQLACQCSLVDPRDPEVEGMLEDEDLQGYLGRFSQATSSSHDDILAPCFSCEVLDGSEGLLSCKQHDCVDA